MRWQSLVAVLAMLGVSQAAAQYVPAELIEHEPPQYPPAALRQGLEGWVLLSYVIEADGSVAGILVEDSSDPAFEAPAQRAFSRFRYSPATLDGVPVASSRRPYRITFLIDGAERGVSSFFHTRARRFQQTLDGGDVARAAEVLRELEERRPRSISEDAWLSWLRAAYHRATADADARHASLVRAVGLSDQNFLNEGVYPIALGMLYASYVERGELPPALRVWERMHDAGGEAARLAGLLREHRDSLQRALDESPVIRSNGKINGEHAWSRELTRRSFELDVVEGRVEALSLRCEYRVEELTYSADAAWTVPETWGACLLFVTGDADTSFTVLEYLD